MKTFMEADYGTSEGSGKSKLFTFETGGAYAGQKQMAAIPDHPDYELCKEILFEIPDGYWTVTTTTGTAVAVVCASSQTNAEWRIRNLGFWHPEWQVRQSNPEEFARALTQVLNGSRRPGAKVFWLNPPL
jgi:hypothetical protein